MSAKSAKGMGFGVCSGWVQLRLRVSKQFLLDLK